MQHFPITTSFLKREGDIYTSIMQDIMRAYLLFKSAPLEVDIVNIVRFGWKLKYKLLTTCTIRKINFEPPPPTAATAVDM